MRLPLLFALVSTSLATAQADFEFAVQGPPCAYFFPSPCGALGDPEGVSQSPGVPPPAPLALATVDIWNGVGMPTAGYKYARIPAAGPYPVPCGGPKPRPHVPGFGTELCIPVPAGSTFIGFEWDFYNAEGAAAGILNDGLSIDLVGAGGGLIAVLVYADTYTALGPGLDGAPAVCPSLAFEAFPAGSKPFSPQSLAMFVAPTPPGAYLSAVVWNGGDNLRQSHGVIDNVRFTPRRRLAFSHPGGVGTLEVENLDLAPFAPYFTALTLTAGAFPFGWFSGVDIPFTELALQVAVSAPPFFGVADAAGHSSFVPAFFVPPGLTLYGVTIELAPLSLVPAGASAPVMFVT